MAAISLTQLAKILKSEMLLIALAILSLGLISFTIYSFMNPQIGTPEQQSAQVAWQNDILPGSTTQSELISSLGQPIETDTSSGPQSLFYQATDNNRRHEIIISNGIVEVIKEKVTGSEQGKLSYFTSKYGQPDNILYGKYGAAAPAHFWGNEGLIIYASIHDGTIIEIWYFSPTTLNDLLLSNTDLSLDAPQGP